MRCPATMSLRAIALPSLVNVVEPSVCTVRVKPPSSVSVMSRPDTEATVPRSCTSTMNTRWAVGVDASVNLTSTLSPTATPAGAVRVPASAYLVSALVATSWVVPSACLMVNALAPTAVTVPCTTWWRSSLGPLDVPGV